MQTPRDCGRGVQRKTRPITRRPTAARPGGWRRRPASGARPRSSGRPEVIQPSTRFCAETTVLWLRRPKKWPISLRAARVCFRASHIASIRGWLTRFPLTSDCRLAGSSPKTSQTAFSMSCSRTARPLCAIRSASASSAIASEIGRPSDWLVASNRHRRRKARGRGWSIARRRTAARRRAPAASSVWPSARGCPAAWRSRAARCGKPGRWSAA